MLGRPVWEFTLEKEFAREIVRAKLVTGNLAIMPFERAYLRKDGKSIWVLIKEHPLKDPQGRLVGIRSTLQDITERKRADEERLVLQEQLRHSQKMEAVGQLAGGVAHDFNNLLTVIQGNCELSLFDLHEGDPLKGNIEEIKKASERAAGLTRQLLAFSRRQVLESKVLDLNGVLRDLEKMLRRVIGEDVALETGLAENLWRVKTDPGQIEQVIINLAVNARDAMPTGGKLIIETANVELDEDFGRSHIGVEPGRYVQLSVSDTGVGMTPEVRERIFDPFFTTKEKGKGTGLGLSTVYGIVSQSGGSIWVYSETRLGSTFKIYLPRADEGRVDAEARGEEREIPRGRETVLLVEDEDAVRRIAAEFLRKQGYTVLEAHQGGDALLICRRTESVIHLMVTDVVMPGMSGRELVENLAPLKPEMRILYMSGYTDNAIVHHGVLEPGVNFLQKPFTLNDLARKVRDVLDEG
jgi:two-component system, cell cycle sensor histidine kinase and response regulator CckA